jgi:UPF0176 protein
MTDKYQVLLFYKYISIVDPKKVRDEQRAFCESLDLKGRIIVSFEGINGTVEGRVENTEKYIQEMGKSKYFSDITFKKSAGTGEAFPKLSVKFRPEVVTTKVDGLDPNKTTGKYLSAEELHQWYEQPKKMTTKQKA